MSNAQIATDSYANWRAGYDEGRRTERAEATPLPLSARIPSHWLADQAIAAAVALLDQNPDLTDDEDIGLALASEEPRALDFIHAFVAAMLAAEDTAEAARQRAKLLRERAAVMDARAERLRDKLVEMVQRLGVARIETPSGTISLRETPLKVSLAVLDELPPEFIRVSREPDKTAILAAWRAGRTVPGAVPSNARQTLALRVKP